MGHAAKAPAKVKAAVAARCPHQLGCFHDKDPERPRNTRLARVAWPCVRSPGHNGGHRTWAGREWT